MKKEHHPVRNVFAILTLIAILPNHFLMAEPSASVRKNKTVMVETHLGFNGIGTGLGIFLPDDSRLDISTGQSDLMVFAESNKVYKLEYQSFVANSFYYALGLNQRIIKTYNYDYDSSQGSYSTKIEAVHAHFTIGNEWSFRYFFIGAEWFGLSTPLSWQYTSSYPDDATESQKTRRDRYDKRAAINTVVILPNLYIGFAF